MDHPTIDSRSFHAFVFQGDKLVHDRATGTTLAVDDASFFKLQRIEQGASLSEAAGALSPDETECEENAFVSAVTALQNSGFFQYEPVDHAEQEQLLQLLWRHKPRRVQLLMAQGCNLGCRYCYAWRNGSNQKGVLMDWKVAKQAVDFLVS